MCDFINKLIILCPNNALFLFVDNLPSNNQALEFINIYHSQLTMPIHHHSPSHFK